MSVDKILDPMVYVCGLYDISHKILLKRDSGLSGGVATYKKKEGIGSLSFVFIRRRRRLFQKHLRL